eukprot:5782567-Alexandrium_andersonii.AAC.1
MPIVGQHVPATESQRQQMRNAGHELFTYLLNMYSVRKITSKDFAILTYWCDRAQVLGADFHRFGVSPGQATGNYQKHLDRVLPHDIPLDWAQLPSMERGSPERVFRKVPFNLPHEALAREVKCTPDVWEQFENTQWPPSYSDHPLVEASRERGDRDPLPVALFVDG